MSIVSLQSVFRCFGHEVVFDALCQEFHAGEKVGMVGVNGSGKTTLLRLVMGEIQPEGGKVVRQKGLRIGYLPQEASFDGMRTVIEEMHAGLDEVLDVQKQLHALAEQMETAAGEDLHKVMTEYERLSSHFERAGGYAIESRIKTILAGLGIEKELYNVRTSALSGGQLSRLGLAKVLLKDTDLLLLDEPTNHLDLQATVWLERFIRNYEGAAIIVSHDRYLLDRAAHKIVEISGGKSATWKGNYSEYVANKDKVSLQQEREHTRRVEMVERTRDFIARNKDREGMRKTARGRKKRLDRLLAEQPDFLSKPQQEHSINFGFKKGGGRSQVVLRCEGLSKRFDSVVLFEGLTFDVLSGERLGITGPNGTGKSTLLRLALGQMEVTAGKARLAETLTVGYLDQQAKVLDNDKTVLEEARSIRPDLSEEALRGRLGAFLFSGDDAFKKVSQLSGGQQNRLMLCRLVLTEPDVLLLDEPTNHLDITSREMLEDALCEYAGTVIVVSHDRYFLDSVADNLLVLGVNEYGERSLGNFEFVTGDNAYSLYAEQIQQRAAKKRGQAQEKKAGGADRKRQRPAKKNSTDPDMRKFNKFTVEQLEEMIMSLEEKIEEIQEEFGDEKYYRNPELLQQLQAGLEADKTELELLYRAYESRGR
jgi:ATP-binding cassette subfamily F protein 3